MFHIPISELVDAAERTRLRLLRNHEFPDMLGRQDVSWTMLAFERENRV